MLELVFFWSSHPLNEYYFVSVWMVDVAADRHWDATGRAQATSAVTIQGVGIASDRHGQATAGVQSRKFMRHPRLGPCA